MDSVITILVALIASSGFWTFINQVTHSRNDKMTELLERIESNLDKNQQLTLAMGRDRLNHLCNKYLEIKYIPKEEYVAFKSCGDAYIAADGNTEVKEKFEYILDNFKIQ